MSVPHLIVALAVLFWGWQVSLLPLALPLAALLFLPAVTGARFQLGRPEFHRVFDVCWVVGIAGLLVIYNQENVGNVFRQAVQWLPVAAAPALLAQVWSAQGRIPRSALVPWPRWRRAAANTGAEVDLSVVFIAACLLAASGAGGGRPSFFPGVAILLATLLWLRRAPGAPVVRAALLLLLAGALGWGTQHLLAMLQPWIENRVAEWTTRWDRDRSSARVARTAVGRTGPVRLSPRVIFTVRDEGPRPMPGHLRMAAFSQWRDGTWFAPSAGFEKIEGNVDEWLLDPRPGRAGVVQVELARAGTSGLLPLPGGTRVVRDFPADSVERNRLGAVRAESGPRVVSFRAEHAQDAEFEEGPGPEDASGVHPAERPAVEAIVEELGLRGLPTAEALQRLGQFFQMNFRYTLDLKDTATQDPRAYTPIGRFLLGHRTGHCEYFATAAVLVLRAAGIPARYATGFLLDPTERNGSVYRVRETSSHAWVRVWVDGVWTDFDPTPGADLALALAPSREGLGRWSQLWHDLRFSIMRWWWLGEKALLRQAYWLAVPLLVVLLWRFRLLRTRHKEKAAARSARRSDWPGADSEWFAVERALAERGWDRGDREPFVAWRRRLASTGWDAAEVERVLDAAGLHARLRFDPRGLPPTDRERLRDHARHLLEPRLWSRA